MVEKTEVIKDILFWLTDVIEVEREEFSGFATCPFAKAERLQNKVYIAKFDSEQESIVDIVKRMSDDGYESGLFALFQGDNPVVLSEDDTRPMQKVLNKALRLSGFGQYKNVCFNPNDTLEIEGFNPRSSAPYFMINVAHKKVLQKANKSLQKTNYYDKLPSSYRKYLKLDL